MGVRMDSDVFSNTYSIYSYYNVKLQYDLRSMDSFVSYRENDPSHVKAIHQSHIMTDSEGNLIGSLHFNNCSSTTVLLFVYRQKRVRKLKLLTVYLE